jgi:hypothetical protein
MQAKNQKNSGIFLRRSALTRLLACPDNEGHPEASIPLVSPWLEKFPERAGKGQVHDD